MGAFIPLGIQGVSSLISLFNRPDIPYDQFQKEVMPTLLSTAREKQRDCYCFWYGEILGITPTGEFKTLGRASTVDDAWNVLVEYSKSQGRSIWALWNGQIKEVIPNIESSGLGLDLPGVSAPTFGVTVVDSALSNIWLLLLILLIVLYVWRKR